MNKSFVQALLGLLVLAIAPAYAEINIDKLAKGNWLQLTSPNFEIITDLKQPKAMQLMEDMEAYRYFQQELFGLKLLEGLPPLRILALGSSSSFKRMDLPRSWAGVFSITEDHYYAIANVDNYSSDLKKPSFGRQVLLHEYTHFLSRFAQNRRSFPLWYEEGKAEYMGTFKFDGDKIYLGNPQAIKFRIQGLYSQSGSMQIKSESVFKTSELPLHSTRMSDLIDVDQFYARAFFIMHYFNSDPALRKSLGLYLGALAAGKSEDEALDYALHISWAQLDKQVENYVVKALMMRVISLTNGNIVFPKPQVAIKKLTVDEFKSEIPFFISDLNQPKAEPKARQ